MLLLLTQHIIIPGTAILGDWIDTQFGDSYIIKVYKGDPNSGGTLLSAAGSGSNDTWFFDYASGVLNFNGTVVPSGVTDTNIYLVGYRYIGAKGTAVAGINTEGTSIFENVSISGNAGIGSLNVTGVSTFAGLIDANGGITATTGTFEDLGGTGRIVFSQTSGSAGRLDDSGNLSYEIATNILNAGNIVSQGDHDIAGNAGIGSLNVTGVSTFAGITSVTSTHSALYVPQLSSSGVVTATTFSGSGASLTSIPNGALDNSTVSYGGVSLALGASDATPAFNLTDATNYPYTSLTGITTTILGDTTPKLGGNLDGNSKSIFGVGVLTATTFDGNLATTNLTGTITNAQLAGSIVNAKLVNDSVSYGGVEVDLGAADATPAFNLTDATNYPYTSLTGITTDIIGDTSPQLGGDLDGNSKSIYGVGVITATTLDISGDVDIDGDTELDQVNVSAASTFGGLVDIDAGAQANTLKVEDLTDNRLVIAGTGGELEDSSKVTFDGTTFAILGDATFSGNVTIGGTLTKEDVTNIDAVGLITAQSGVRITAGGLVISSGVATFTDAIDANGGLDVTGGSGLVASTAKISDLTSGRVVVAGTSGELEDASTLTFSGGTLSATTFSGSGASLTSITNSNLSGSAGITNANLANSTVSYGGISLALGASDATPAFDLTDATNYPTSSLTGTITNAQLAGSIANDKLANSTVSYGGISLALGGTDATPAFDLTDATNYPTSSLTGTITNAQLAGSIANDKLANSTVSYGGISLALGALDATPAFDLTDATNYPYTSLTGITTDIVGDTTPTLGGNLDGNSKSIFGVGIITATTFSGNLTGTVNTAAQTNITSVGTLTSLDVSGNITGAGDLTLTDTTADSAAGPELKLFRNSASPADADYLGQIKFAGESDTGVERNYAKITGKILDASNGTEDGIIEFAHIKAGSQVITGRFRSDSLQLLNDTALSVSGDITANGNIVGDTATNISGINSVTATTYYGDGTKLVGIATTGAAGFSPDAQENLYAGTGAGANSTSDSCYNVAIGYKALNTYASDGTFVGCNVAIGKCAGFCVSGSGATGLANVYIGNNAGRYHTTNNSVFIGHYTMASVAGGSGGTDSVLIGARAGQCLKNGTSEVFIGCGAGYHTCSGGSNTFLGQGAGQYIKTGSANTFLGRYAGRAASASSSSHNTAIGSCAGWSLTSGACNIFLGNRAGCRVTSGSRNIAIGHNLELPSATGDHQLGIGSATNYWIVGNANWNVGIGTTNPDIAVGVGNTAKLSVGILSAYQLYGDGQYLTNVGGASTDAWAQDGQANLVAGTNAGASINGDTSCNVLIGQDAGTMLAAASGSSSADSNVMIGVGAGKSSVTTYRSILIGEEAGKCGTSNFNIAVGYNALKEGGGSYKNIVIGHKAGSLSNTKMTASNMRENVLLGYNAAYCGVGQKNVMLGSYVGYGATMSCQNIFIGEQAGYGAASLTGTNNISIGLKAGCSLAAANNTVLIGCHAGIKVTTGSSNVFIGNKAGSEVTFATDNTFVGGASGLYQYSGCSNTGFGYRTLFGNATPGNNTGCYNTALGSWAGSYVSSGSKNSLIGYRAGVSITSGGCNVIIGAHVDPPSATSNTQLAIGCNQSHWITGNANFNVGIGTTNS